MEKMITEQPISTTGCSSSDTKRQDRGGSKAFHLHREKMVSSQKIGKIKLYRLTHYKPGTGWTSENFLKNYVNMISLKCKVIDDGSDPLTEDEICAQVLGAKGRGNIAYQRGNMRRNQT
ncbi:hypothetical protein ACHQM5_014935 [Ranunculus cassubicifolius]